MRYDSLPRPFDYALVLLAVFALILSACDEQPPVSGMDADGGPSRSNGERPIPASMLEFPCEVQRVLATHCATCHGEELFGGAPLSLVADMDFRALSTSHEGQTVAERVRVRVQDSSLPMPPVTQPEMSEEDQEILLRWLDEDQPRRTEDDLCEPTPIRDLTSGVGPDFLECEVTHRFVASAPDSDAPFPLEAGGENANSYWCFPFENPFPEGSQATAWAPIIDNSEVLHHWLLWGSNRDAPSTEPFPCAALPTGDAAFVSGWAPGGQNAVMPEDVGLDLRYKTLYLQLHYWNPEQAEGLTDQSGVAFCATQDTRPHTAGILTVGTLDINLPPRSRDTTASFECEDWQMPTQDGFTVLSSGPHMHQLGTRFLSEVIRADGTRDPIGRVDSWNFDDQTPVRLERPIEVFPGDRLGVQCTYDNPLDQNVRFGEGTDDEMCFDFMLVYPVNDIPLSRRRCLGL